MALSVTIDLPDHLEQSLRLKYGSLDGVAKEAVWVDLYRRNEITQAELARALGLSRLEVDGILKSHGVMLEMTADDFATELADLRSTVQDDRRL